MGGGKVTGPVGIGIPTVPGTAFTDLPKLEEKRDSYR